MDGDDNGMDPCECLLGHQLAMRRLLNLLRNSQSFCNDNECFRDGPPRNPQGPDHALIMTLFVVVAVFLCYFRSTTQRITDGPEKPKNNSRNDSNGAPPSPPSATF